MVGAMRHFLFTIAGVFAGMLLFLIAVPFVLLSLASGAVRSAPIPANAVLELDLRSELTDQPPTSTLAALTHGAGSVLDIVDALDQAAKDDRVQAVFVRLPEGGMAPAGAEEIHEALERFEEHGKSVWAHSQGFYPSGSVIAAYMVGAGADRLLMQPGAAFQATGMVGTDVFYKRFFDRYGISPQFEQRQEYKNAVNPYLKSDYTPAHRESEQGWMGSIT